MFVCLSRHGLNFMTDAVCFPRASMITGTRLLLWPCRMCTATCWIWGCGWGAIGVAVKKKYPAAHVTMVDVNRRALELCRFNAVRNGITAECLESDGMAEVMERTFDFIITNPPIRASKPVIYRMFADAASRLNPGGALYLVIRKQQGAESCMKYLKTLYAKVDKVDKSGGFWVLRATEPLKKENEAQEEAADAHV